MSTKNLAELRTALESRFPAACRPRVGLERNGQEQTLVFGAVTEVVGARGAGGLSWVLRRMADVLASSRGLAAFVDPLGELYPPAVSALGVPLDRVLLLRPARDLALVLRMAEVLIRGGAVRIVVIDVPDGTAPLRLSTYHRLRRRVEENNAVLVVLTRGSVVPADHRVSL